ncbi:YbaB/EbfC family nucleoid-associated protein [Xanthobacter flavus]|uniref:YbaB/EbfC family nucleoid-associated protein n=1 Tax=Xanthobacter flavus TaxID=281 RepID=UPI0037273502
MRDLMGMMKQAKELQDRMQQMQAELETVEVDGASGGGLVSVRVTAKGECKAVRIDPSLVKPEEVEILEDLIVAALADARGKAERVMQEKMQSLTGGLALPPGLKLF